MRQTLKVPGAEILFVLHDIISVIQGIPGFANVMLSFVSFKHSNVIWREIKKIL